MCGIAGFIDYARDQDADRLRKIASAMASTLRHRGPDDHGSWVDHKIGLALGHQRLTVLDLSADGHQPMSTSCGSYVITFNGEIYNYRELRAQLQAEGVRLTSSGDTEVLLQACMRWGVRAAVQAANGMFAFALFDKQRQTLTLARDRMGIKPLYYADTGDCLMFASELKALRCHPRFPAQICRGGLTLFLKHNWIPAPYTIYQDTYKLLPGTMLTVPVHDDGPRNLTPKPFWSLDEVAESSSEQRRSVELESGDVNRALDDLQARLTSSVMLRTRADVPFGAFLSGGVDSSLVVALMQSNLSSPVSTFTIGFEQSSYDESQQAARISRHLGTSHTQLVVTPQQALDTIAELAHVYDEPFADSSQIPTFLVAKLAREHVTVCLSGDGGDELYGGYDHYQHMANGWRRLSLMPPPLRRAIGGAGRWAQRLPQSMLPNVVRRKANSLAWRMEPRSSAEYYAHYQTQWKHPQRVVIGGWEPTTELSQFEQWHNLDSFLQQMMFADMRGYLVDDILVKVDRASMAHSLEVRLPMLDHRLVEFAWTIPDGWKRHADGSKWLLRRLLSRYVPASMIESGKRGFAVPLGQWLRGPLRDWAESLLSKDLLRQQGFLRAGPIREKWRQHLSGQIDWQYDLWDVLMFQSWLESASESAYLST